MRYWLIILLLCVATAMFAQTGAAYDSSTITIRSFNESVINEYKNDKQFQYDKTDAPVVSLWERFWIWFWDTIDHILSTPAGRNTFNTIIILLAIAAVVFFILKLMGDRTGLFGAKGKKGLPYQIDNEDIHSISFEDAIRDALESKNYRLAVRLVYLHSLKLLSDKQLIDWKPGKTNTAYVNELNEHRSYHSFVQLTHEFEYTWYGGEEVSKEHYEEIETAFNDFKNNIS